ncbi:hypothetical protein SUGI_0637470 [Cryptomeria japonica]|nr:hypothetical protein SUGI_0637470 [Cryptomeria japonica]
MAEYKESDRSELMGFVDWKRRPAVKGRHGGMNSTFFVYGTELTDNIASAAVLINLVTYLTGFMHIHIAEAANTVTNYAGTGLIIALAGAFVSDAYINKFKTCVVSLCIELLGYIILLIQAHYSSLKPPPCNQLDPNSVCIKIGGAKAGMLLAGLYLVAIGGGGVKGALAPLGADQLDETDPIERRKRSNYFNMFF